MGGPRQQSDPGRAAFAGFGGSNTADQTVIGRGAEAVLQRGPGAQSPILLGGLIDSTEVAQRGEERQMSDPFDIGSGLEPFIEQFQSDQYESHPEYPRYPAKDYYHCDL